MANVKDIRDYFDRVVPSYMKFDFDNVGMLVGFCDAEVRTVLVALDVTDAVIEEAEETGAQLIVYDANGVEVATYVLVLYGEVTGEGEITPLDASVILAAANLDLNEDTGYWQEFDAPDQYAQSMAADVIHDGELTPYDASTLISALKGGRQINQHWKESGDPYTVAA